MKKRIFFALLLIIGAAVFGRYMAHRDDAPASVRVDGEGHEEIHESFALTPGAEVEVRGINGSVEITTADTATAEVHIVRTARAKSELDNQRVYIEHEPERLVVRSEGGSGGFLGWLWGNSSVRQQVKMTVPRRVRLDARGVNGSVTVGEIEGAARVSGINGRVELASVAGHADVSGINGATKIGVAQLDDEGLDIKGNNGSVVVRLNSVVGADVNVKGHRGRVEFSVPNVSIEERTRRSVKRARIGAGGAPIQVKGVNGNIKFETLDSAAPVMPVATQ